ncbi:MAG: phage tail tape measure protein, partial [Muribaculaceae bacterium]|nr:phage tail tape measure protein [Muribaculaceae bacterium]
AEAVESYLAPLRKLRREYDAEMLLLSRAYDVERTNVAKHNSDFSDYPGYEFLSEEEMLKQLEERFVKAQKKLREKYKELFEVASEPNQWESAVKKSLKWLESDPAKAVVKSYSTVVSSLSDIFSQATSIIESELEAQTAAIEKRYDAELKRAEGNAYQIASIERRKEREVAKAKAEANRKMFAMQVIQAVAQTATSALNAYSSAAAVPVVGYILAPIAAAMATASGLMQVAAIRKQQQASEAQGYAEGGFTRPGSKYEPAGVVHAGEWVASQALVNNPATRPILEALDYAQRTNTVGRLAAADVSRSLTAPMVIAHAAQAPAASVASDSRLSEVVDRLARRLDEPFVTVNTVQGDTGIRQAQLRYQRLISNKSPKSR